MDVEARLQIVQSSEVVNESRLDRGMLEPVLVRNTDGLWVLSVRRQGEYSAFEIPYIGSEILLADAELGLVVVLVGYHGSSAEKYGKLGYMVQKGQFYRYYQQQVTGDWQQIYWRHFNDDLRALVLETVEEKGPEWARKPGKLSSERKPPAKHVIMTSYKVVRLINDRYFSLYQPEQEYVLGEKVRQQAKPGHDNGGFFSYPDVEYGTTYLTTCAHDLPFHDEVETPALALLECEIGGRVFSYGHKMKSTYLRPIRVLEIRQET